MGGQRGERLQWWGPALLARGQAAGLDAESTYPEWMAATGCTEHRARSMVKWLRRNHSEAPPTAPMAIQQPAQESETRLNILVIGDAHAHPGDDYARFRMLGRAIHDLAEDAARDGARLHVVSIGDWADMPSLSSYDRGKRSFEGRRYTADIASANEALYWTREGMAGAEAALHVTVGNHEHRILRAANDASELDGLLTLDDIEWTRYGWQVVPFLEALDLGGVLFRHFLPNRIGRAVGGVNHARSIAQKAHVSHVVGHSHQLDFFREVDAAGRVIQTLVSGCFFEHHEGYAGESNRLYWRGLCLLRDVRAGAYDLETITMERLWRRYGRY